MWTRNSGANSRDNKENKMHTCCRLNLLCVCGSVTSRTGHTLSFCTKTTGVPPSYFVSDTFITVTVEVFHNNTHTHTRTHTLVSRGQGKKGAAGSLLHLWPLRLTLIWSHMCRRTHSLQWPSSLSQKSIGSLCEHFWRAEKKVVNSLSPMKPSLLIMINTLCLISVNLPHSLRVGLQIEK